MTDLPFIIAGWVGTAAVLAGYSIGLVARTRRISTRRPIEPEVRR